MTPPELPDELYGLSLGGSRFDGMTNLLGIRTTDAYATAKDANDSIDPDCGGPYGTPTLIGVHPRYREALQRILELLTDHAAKPYDATRNTFVLGKIAGIASKACGKSDVETSE